MAQALTTVSRRIRRVPVCTFTTRSALASFTTRSALASLAAFTLMGAVSARAQIAQPSPEPPAGSIYGSIPGATPTGSDSAASTAPIAPPPGSETAPPAASTAPSLAPPSAAATTAPSLAPTTQSAPPIAAPGIQNDNQAAHPAEHAVEHPHEHVAPEHSQRVPSGQGRRGFVVAAQFGVRPTFASALNAGAVTTSMTSALQGGLGIGFKTGRVVMTLGLDLGAIDVRDTFTYRTTTTFLIVPGLQVALVRSKDHRVELVGSLRVGAGSTMTTDASSTLKSPALVMYEIAPAVRYWAHKQFAVQFLAGYGGEYSIVSTSSGNTATGQHGLSAAIGTIGIF